MQEDVPVVADRLYLPVPNLRGFPGDCFFLYVPHHRDHHQCPVPAATLYPAATDRPTGEGSVNKLGMLALACM